MQILGSVLPGLREIRAPVIAGYLWLVLVWVLISPDVDTRPSDGVLSSVYDLGQEVGRLGIAIAVGVIAYLLGSVSQALGDVIPRFASMSRPSEWSGFSQLLMPLDFVLGFFLRPVPPVEMRPIERVERALARARTAVESAGRGLRAEQVARLRTEAYNELDGRYRIALLDARSELQLPATVLVGDKPELFAEVDRLRAEADLRVAVVPPLVALTIVFAYTHCWYWLLALVPILFLLRQGLIRADQSRRAIFDAITQRYVESSSQADFESWVNRFIDETLPGLVAREGAVFDIMNARWRGPNRGIDVTERLRLLVVNDRLEVSATNETMGEDPEAGHPKQLELLYRASGGQYSMTFDEGTDVRLPLPGQ